MGQTGHGMLGKDAKHANEAELKKTLKVLEMFTGNGVLNSRPKNLLGIAELLDAFTWDSTSVTQHWLLGTIDIAEVALLGIGVCPKRSEKLAVVAVRLKQNKGSGCMASEVQM